MTTAIMDVSATLAVKDWFCKRMWMARPFSKTARSPHLKSSKQTDAQTFGYARVSTRDQKLDMQLDALAEYGVPENNIYVEKISGSSRKRPAFDRLMRAVRPGDTIVVWKQDRFGRRALNIMQQLLELKERKINFVSLTERLDFDTPIGEFMGGVLALMSQFEVRMTAQRTKTGIEAHKSRGNAYGRKVEFDLAKAKAHLLKHKNLSAAAKHVGVTRQRLNYHVQRDPALARLKLK